jgi:hypothetical protein
MVDTIKRFVSYDLSLSFSIVNWLQHRIMERYYVRGPINSLIIGSGGGNEVYKLCYLNNSVTTIEHDPVAKVGIDKMMEGLSNARYEVVVGDAVECVQSQKVQFVLMSQVLEHIDDDYGLLKKLAEICSPHARLIISTPTSLHGLLGSQSIVDPIAKGPNHVRVGYEGKELDLLCKSLGLHKLARFYLGNPVLNVIWLVDTYFIQKKWVSLPYKVFRLLFRYLLIPLSWWVRSPYIQISIYTKMPTH